MEVMNMADLHLTPEEIQILSTVDHTMLSQTATWEQILALCEEVLALATCESRALSGALDYQPQEFSRRRNNLLQSLKQA